MTATLVKDDDPILHRASTPVPASKFENHSIELKPIATLLLEQIYLHNALGISACQIGIDMSMIAFDVNGLIRVCINPEIVAVPIEADMPKEKEGCLSYPGLELKVKRPSSVIVRYKDIDGVEVQEKLDGLAARVFLHEYDHTKGMCFVDRVSKLTLDMAMRKKEKNEKRSKL